MSPVRVREDSGTATAVRGAAVAAAAFGVLATAVALIGIDNALARTLLLVLLLGAPGGAVAVMLRTLEPLGRVLCALVSAVLVNAAIAQTMLSLELWSIPGGVVAVGVLSSLGWFLALRAPAQAAPVTADVVGSAIEHTGDPGADR
jgi:hypothetical protein